MLGRVRPARARDTESSAGAREKEFNKMKALGEQLALDHRRMTAWYELDFQTDSAEFKPIDVGVARSGVRLEVSDRRRIQ
jgi:hypothetical protein